MKEERRKEIKKGRRRRRRERNRKCEDEKRHEFGRYIHMDVNTYV